MQFPGQPSQQDLSSLVALFNRGQFAEAAVAAQALTLRFPQHPAGWIVLGAALKQQGRNADALLPMQKAVALAPGNAESHSNLGATLRELGRTAEAVSALQRALALKPCLLEALVNLGNALTDLGRLSEAEACYRRVLAISPASVMAHNGLGNVLARLGRYEEAVSSCRRALELQPDYAFAHFNLGVALHALGRLDDAVACYQRALRHEPESLDAYDNLLFVRSHQAGRSTADALAEARLYGQIVARRSRPFLEWSNRPDPDRRLRVGLVSGDLRNHPVGFFVECVLEAVGRNYDDRLEVFAYPSYLDGSEVTARIQRHCRGWCPVEGASDAEVAARVRADQIDILIDLAGHTAHNRLPLFAWKPAPVQATWLGYLATTGVAAIDYVIADPLTLTASEEANFTERVWRVPESYLCFTPPDAELPVLPPPAAASGRVTFGCFNNLTKMNDGVVALWAGILLAVPGSRLFLKTGQLGQEGVRAALTERFAARGVEPARLIMEGQSPRAELLAAYHRVDLALDPFPYPGITSTLEALWMGVPVLTLAGESFLARQGVGLLTNAGLPE